MDPPQQINWNSGTRTTIRTTLGLGGDGGRGSPRRANQPGQVTGEPEVVELSDTESKPTARALSVVVQERSLQDSVMGGSEEGNPIVLSDDDADVHSGMPTSSSTRGGGRKSRDLGAAGAASGDLNPAASHSGAEPQHKRKRTSLSPEISDSNRMEVSHDKEERDSEESDMLMVYSRSEPAAQHGRTVADRNASQADQPQDSMQGLHVQVDLLGSLVTEHDKELQRRYFDVVAPTTADLYDLRAKPSAESDLFPNKGASALDDAGKDALVRCLSCRAVGHPQESCPELKCGNCGKIGLHFMSACPSLRKCPRCRHPSHTGPCPAEVANTDCQICQGDGHVEASCTALWRSFDPDLVTLRKVRQLPVFCYNCGSNLHFGFECKMRRLVGPQYAKGETFSWKNASRYIDYDSPNVGISVDTTGPPRLLKKRLAQDSSAKPEDNDVDPAQFIQPAVNRDEGRTNHIRFGNSASSQGPAYQQHRLPERPGASGYTNHAGGNSFGRNPSSQGSGAGQSYPPPPRSDCYRPNESHGPPGADHWQPPLPAGPPPSGPSFRAGAGAPNRQQNNARNSYRPMPSAGQKAWKKHRT